MPSDPRNEHQIRRGPCMVEVGPREPETDEWGARLKRASFASKPTNHTTHSYTGAKLEEVIIPSHAESEGWKNAGLTKGGIILLLLPRAMSTRLSRRVKIYSFAKPTRIDGVYISRRCSLPEQTSLHSQHNLQLPLYLAINLLPQFPISSHSQFSTNSS